MARLPISCVVCQAELTGNEDTFGDFDTPMCWKCYSGLMFPNLSENRYQIRYWENGIQPIMSQKGQRRLAKDWEEFERERKQKRG